MAKESLAKKYDKADKHLKRAAGSIGAILAIISAATGICTWVSNQFQSAVSAQIEEFREEVKESDESQSLAIMRLELMSLIAHDPDNVVEIERLGKRYFQAGGNSWMSSIYSEYAKEHDLDTSFLMTGGQS